MSTIAKAFVNAKRAFGPALKDKTNPAFRSKYADLGACLEAVEDALLSNGIALYQETFDDATGVTVETVLLHESGETIRCGKLHVPAAKQDPQGYGSALTYARRYSVMAACGIAPEDDDGNAASKKTVKPEPRGVIAAVKATSPELPKDQQEYLHELAANVADLFKGSQGIASAFDRIEADALDNDQLIFLWDLLPANIRSALKVERAKRNTVAA